MNILLEITTTNYKIWHALAVHLARLYPGSRVAAIVGIAPGGEYVLDYLNDQREIKYEFIHLSHELVAQALAGEIDHQALAEFEARSTQKSLWRMIAADRGWGKEFLHGAEISKSFINLNNSRENILKVFSGLVKTYRNIFNGFEVDLFLPAIAMGSVSVFIFEQLCAERGIPYIAPTSARTKNLFAFAEDVRLRFPRIDQTYRRIMEGAGQSDLSAAEKLYEEIMSELEDPQYFDRLLPCFNIKKLDSPTSKLKFMARSLRLFGTALYKWRKQRKFNKSNDIRRQPYGLGVLFDNLALVFKHVYQNYHVLAADYGVDLPVGKKYLYYPLHTSPEYSTQFQATMWMDQLNLIELLAKSVPFDWVVYVKEHPLLVTARTRPMDFYKKLKRLPNVVLAKLDANSHELIMNAQMVAVVTGTSGWEAVQRGKPLITFADNFWDCLDLSRKCSDVETLSVDIHDELERINKISDAERKRRLTCFLGAVLEHSFELTYPQQFCYEPGTDEQFKVVARETAEALKRHLESLKNEKPRSAE